MKNVNIDNSNGEPIKEKSFFREVIEWLGCIIIAFLIAVLVRYFVFTPTLVKQTSMYPTIYDGERVIINRLARTFKTPLYRGDIITFEMPDYTENGLGMYNKTENWVQFIFKDVLEVSKISYIKRVIGIAGDHVEIRRGDVYVNDQKLSEVYLEEGLETPSLGQYHDVKVPEGYIFVMGDNRGGSSDSREFGCIPISKVEGKVSLRIWPLTRFGSIDK